MNMKMNLMCDDVLVHFTNSQQSEGEGMASPAGPTVAVLANAGTVECGRRLLLAARAGDTDTVRQLMAKGAPFTTDWLGTSPLHLAAANNHLDTVQTLLRAGVSRDARTKVDRTPLHLAACSGAVAAATALLEAGAIVDARDMLAMTPLHWAAQRGHKELAELLLSLGASHIERNKFRLTPRDVAARAGHEHIVMLIDEHEAMATARRLRQAEEPTTSETETAPTVFDLDDGNQNQIEEGAENQCDDAVEAGVKSKVNHQSPCTSKARLSPGAPPPPDADAMRAGSAAAARLLKSHGIAPLPAEPDGSGTVLRALHSGRTVALSDAGKIMLAESSATPISASGRNVVLRARPVPAPPPGARVFQLQRPITPAPAPANMVQRTTPVKQTLAKTVIPLRTESKPVHDKSSESPSSAGSRPAVKIIMNRANFRKLVAGGAVTLPKQQPQRPPPSPTPAVASTATGAVVVPESWLSSSSVSYLRGELLACGRTIAELRAELSQAKAEMKRLRDNT